MRSPRGEESYGPLSTRYRCKIAEENGERRRGCVAFDEESEKSKTRLLTDLISLNEKEGGRRRVE